MQVVILCGGQGTRLREQTESIPKPLVEIGGRPIVWHVMKLYACFGVQDFILCLGYKGDMIKEYFKNAKDWNIIFADTGLETNTGGRIKLVEDMIDGDTFMATYADGVADIDIRASIDFHKRHNRIGTMTVVNPLSQFGEVVITDTGMITDFREKPKLSNWINGGFFVFDKKFFSYLEEDSVLEKEPLTRLAKDGNLYAFKHEGFWKCMDTFKDMLTLNEYWADAKPPWKLW